MRVLGRIAAVVALAAIAGACGGDGKGITEVESAAGTYSLTLVNGTKLPFVFFDEAGYKLEVTGASYTLTSAGTFSSSATLRETEDGVVSMTTETFGGTYTVSGKLATFVDSDGESLNGSIVGNTLSFSQEGITVVYVR